MTNDHNPPSNPSDSNTDSPTPSFSNDSASDSVTPAGASGSSFLGDDRTDPQIELPQSSSTRSSPGEKLSALRERFRTALSNRLLQVRQLRSMDPSRLADSISRLVQSQGLHIYGTLATVLLSTYFLSDVTALLVGKYIPEPPTLPGSRQFEGRPLPKTIDSYSGIFTRNLFNSQGLIAGDDAPAAGTPQDLGGAPVRTSLPLNLVGTLILRDELRSLATIEDKGAAQTYPVRIEDEIPGKARILKIEARKVVFINIGTGRREFVDLPEEGGTGIPQISVGGGGNKFSGIEKVSATQYNVARSEVDKTLADLNNVLTQARALPNFENGQPNGYSITQIVPGSIYEKLGLQNGDIILGLNGQPINDPAKAFELLSELKTSNHLELQIKRAGRGVSNQVIDIR
jgi:general secretion pathway protein C